jgi:signal transduction histidine kinase
MPGAVRRDAGKEHGLLIRPRRGRRRQFRSLASQITLLVSIPLIVLLAAAALGSLLLNHNSRLSGSRSTNAGLADATAVAARAIRVDAFALLRQPASGGEVPAPFAIVVDFERGDRGVLEQVLPRVPGEARPAISRSVLVGPGETVVAGPLIDVETGYADLVFAAGDRDGRVVAGIVHIAPTSLAGDWRRFVADRLGAPDETDLALVDANSFVLFHTSPERAGRSSLGIAGDDVPLAAVVSEVRTAPDGEVAITGSRPVGDGWHIVVQRPWAGWREALNGPGLPVVFMLVASALITTALLTLSASRLTRPLRDLAEAARAIAAGDFTARPPPIRTGDEVEDLADQFDIMTAELESLYSGLEQRVASRTAELQAVVDLAGAVSRTFDAGQVAGVAEARLQQHPGITAAAVWLPERSAELTGYRPAAPEWLPVGVLQRLAGAGQAEGDERVSALYESSGEQTVRLLALPLEDENAVLAVACHPGADPEFAAFLEAVAAHITIALANAVLYRRGRSAAALEERTRLARDIHDTLAQSFTGVIVQLEALTREQGAPPGSADRIGRTLDLARAGLGEARRSVRGLRSSELDSQSVGEALRARINLMETPGGILIRLNIEGDDTAIAEPIAAELFRIAEEALTNVQRHAEARHALVNLQVREDDFRLVIEDDGVGMAPGAAAAAGFGLTGMRERAERAGGKLSIESDPGEGTRVEVTIARTTDGPSA